MWSAGIYLAREGSTKLVKLWSGVNKAVPTQPDISRKVQLHESEQHELAAEDHSNGQMLSSNVCCDCTCDIVRVGLDNCGM